MAKITAAAFGKHGAVGLDAVRRGLQHPQQFAEGIGLFHLDQQRLQPVAPGGAGDKNGHALLRPSHAQPLGGIALDGERDGLILFRHYSHASIISLRSERGISKNCAPII